MVLEPKTAVLALALRDAGADVTVFAHHYETDDAVARELRDRGIPVLADGTGDADSDRALALRLLDTEPHLLLDDGAHVIRLAHRERPALVEAMLGAAEETTSGIRAVRALGDELRMPVVAVNDAVTKTRFDNRYGTGQSCVFAIADTLEAASAQLRVASFDDARVVVIGFGPVGQGVAQFATALGGHVSVCDVDPRAELEARYAGYETGSAAELVPGADIVISATGVAHTVPLDLLEVGPPGAVFAVAGGVDDEIEVERLRTTARSQPVDEHLETFTFADGRAVAVIDDGDCVNITAGEGNPIEIMDLSFAAQLQAVRTLVRAAKRRVGLIPLTADADREVARRALALGSRPAEAVAEGVLP
jgi:adenosylhomocysteinase